MEGLFWQPLPSVGTTTTPLLLEHKMGGLFYVYYYYYYIYILYLIILKNILYKYIIICSGPGRPWPDPGPALLAPDQGQLRVARPVDSVKSSGLSVTGGLDHRLSLQLPCDVPVKRFARRL